MNMAIGKCLRCDKIGKVTEDHIIPQWFLKQLVNFGVKENPIDNTEMVCESCNGTKGGKFDFSFKACRDVMKPIIRNFVIEIRKHEQFDI